MRVRVPPSVLKVLPNSQSLLMRMSNKECRMSNVEGNAKSKIHFQNFDVGYSVLGVRYSRLTAGDSALLVITVIKQFELYSLVYSDCFDSQSLLMRMSNKECRISNVEGNAKSKYTFKTSMLDIPCWVFDIHDCWRFISVGHCRNLQFGLYSLVYLDCFDPQSLLMRMSNKECRISNVEGNTLNLLFVSI
jgi:hypothetical protein